MNVILQVKDPEGQVVLEVDESGGAVASPRLEVAKNTVPARIQSAAAGGATLEQLEREAVVCDDIELAGLGVSIPAGGDIKGATHKVELHVDRDTFLKLINYRKSGRLAELEDEGSTLRMVLFEADQVHQEAEPEPDPDTLVSYTQFLDLMQSRFLGECGRKGIEASQILAMFGVKWWTEVPAQGLYLWAADNGLADYLPVSIRAVSHHEELGR